MVININTRVADIAIDRGGGNQDDAEMHMDDDNDSAKRVCRAPRPGGGTCGASIPIDDIICSSCTKYHDQHTYGAATAVAVSSSRDTNVSPSQTQYWRPPSDDDNDDNDDNDDALPSKVYIAVLVWHRVILMRHRDRWLYLYI